MPSSTYVYVLKLAGGRRYVGTTANPDARLDAHRSGRGATYTRRYAPQGGFEVLRRAKGTPGLDEDREVLEQMKTWGMESVRGGSYSNCTLSTTQKDALTTQLRHASGKCLKCGRDGHLAKHCRALTIRVKAGGCSRCGRRGHAASQCYARTTAQGEPLARESESDLEESDVEHLGWICAHCGKEFDTEKGARYHELRWCKHRQR